MVRSYLSESNNKKLGTAFEVEAVSRLAKLGYWAHFITPDTRGAQPFDIIAVKQGKALAIDCKTSAVKRFNISRLEDNQVLAFEKWIRCGNPMPIILVKYKGFIMCIEYSVLKAEKSIDLETYNSGLDLEVQLNDVDIANT